MECTRCGREMVAEYVYALGNEEISNLCLSCLVRECQERETPLDLRNFLFLRIGSVEIIPEGFGGALADILTAINLVSEGATEEIYLRSLGVGNAVDILTEFRAAVTRPREVG